MFTSRNTPNTNIHPEHKNISVKYKIEYTDKPCYDADNDTLNEKEFWASLKEFECQDLESTIKAMFLLRQQEKHNISLWYTVSDGEQWILEDSANCVEGYKDTNMSVKLQKQVNTMQETITAQENELELYRIFLKKYNASEQFKQFKKEMSSSLVAK